MRKTMRLTLVSSLCVLAAIGVGQAGVSVEHASQTDFSQYRTFTWVDGTIAEDEEVEKLLRKTVTEDLRQEGLQLLAEGGDLLVRTHVNLRQQKRQEVSIVQGQGLWSDDVTSATPTGEYSRQVEIGTVTVDLLDGHSRLLVWQGVVGQVPQPLAGKRSEQQFKKAFDKLFKKYPPR